MGLVSPLGDEPDAVFEAAFRGRSAVRLVRSGTKDFGSDVLIAPADFHAGARIPKTELIFQARASQMAVAAAYDAIGRAGLSEDSGLLARSGVYIGCGLGGSEILQEGYRVYYERRSRRLKPTIVPLIMANGPASHISMRFGIGGPSQTFSIACASSSVAIGEAFRAIRDGYLDRALAGGAEAMLNDGSIAGWERLGVMAAPHADGAHASARPFDSERTGLVLGEGAAVLVLESGEALAARAGEPLAEIVGYAATSDAHNLTEPQAAGQERAIRAALKDAGVTPGAVGYLNAHATGTLAGDAVELDAIRCVFGSAAAGLAVSSTKGVHGHLVGAAGALECALTVMALREQRIPPTAHLTRPDPDFGIDLVPVGRAAPDLDVAMSNSFAFGGSNATLVLRRV